MAAKKARRANMSDTVVKAIKFKAADGSDITIESLLRVGALKWLEKKTGKPFAAFAEDLGTGAIIPATQMLTALYLQCNSDATDQEAESVFDHLTLTEMMDLIEQLDVLDFEPKNSPKPTPKQAKTVTAKAS